MRDVNIGGGGGGGGFRGGSRISREGGPNKGEGLHYEAMQYLQFTLFKRWMEIKTNILVYRTGEICLFLKPVEDSIS